MQAMTNTATKISPALQNALSAGGLTVGGGRGFVVEGSREQRYVITAAHCLTERPGRAEAPAPERFLARHRTHLREPAGTFGRTTVGLVRMSCSSIRSPTLPCSAALTISRSARRPRAYAALVEAATPLTVAEPPSQPTAENVTRLADLECARDHRTRAMVQI